jgi:phosphoesterase RecJ-like protein
VDHPDAVSAALRAAAGLLAGVDRVWIGTHVDPDGDAIGSALGLAHVLSGLGTSAVVACADPVPFEAATLPGAETVGTDGPSGEDVLIAVDTADAGRLGALVDSGAWASRPSLVVDHHASNGGFGTVDVIDPRRASTAEIVLQLADSLGAFPTPEAATCLLMGVVTDTLGFRTPNTTADTLAAAQRLIGLGASLPLTTQQAFYTKPLAALRLYGLALQRLTSHGPWAYTWVARADLAATGAPAEAVRGLTSLVATASEPQAVAVLRERDDGAIDVSLRSRPGVDVLPAAAALGGGGHPQASGARVDGPMEDATRVVLAALDDHVTVPGRDRAAAPP